MSQTQLTTLIPMTRLTHDTLALVRGGTAAPSRVQDKSSEYGEKAASIGKPFGPAAEWVGRGVGTAFGFGVGLGNEVNRALGRDSVL